jgi:uncharacterized protein
MNPKLNSELFLIPDGDAYLVYAPLRRYLMRIGADQVNLLARAKNGQVRPEDVESDLYQALVKAGVANGNDEAHPTTSVGKPFAPTRVTLLLTTRCNLACQYCYAGRAQAGLVMDTEIGRAALDYVVANCVRAGERQLSVGFHGGGEPTMAWEQLTTLTLYAEELAAKHHLKLGLGIATNGCLGLDRARWLAKHFEHLNISLDGPPRIQNRLRPRQGGGPSWPLIRKALKVFEEQQVPYSFQTTVTRPTVQEMPAMVRFFARHTRPHILKFEPVANSGRFLEQADEIPGSQEFAHYFMAARQEGERLGVRVIFSGLRLNSPPLSIFCGAFGEPFAITPEGYVSACYEAFCGSSDQADLFHFGRWDGSRREFVIDRDKLERLRQRHVYNLDACAKCFCKYSCAGDCGTRNRRFFGSADGPMASPRCETIREVNRQHLSQITQQVLFNARKANHGDQPHEATLCP